MGIKAFHSTETVLLTVSSSLPVTLDESDIAAPSLQDFSDAFYSVDKNIFCHPLQTGLALRVQLYIGSYQ